MISDPERRREPASVHIGVLDYGSGNLHSACRALQATGAEVVLSSRHEVLLGCDALVLPGVGAYAACMAQLRAVGGDELVLGWVADERPLLGICVGHQVLFERGVEHGVDTAGLGVLPGVVEGLRARPLPHMGWNTVEPAPNSAIFDGLAGERFYFVHSYGVRESELPADELTTAEHGGDRFVAAVEHGWVTSTQFHPEKSGAAGARLLRNWVGGVAGRIV